MVVAAALLLPTVVVVVLIAVCEPETGTSGKSFWWTHASVCGYDQRQWVCWPLIQASSILLVVVRSGENSEKRSGWKRGSQIPHRHTALVERLPLWVIACVGGFC